MFYVFYKVEAITNLIKTIKVVKKITYKILITIDDLDRVPLPKVGLMNKVFKSEL